MNKRILFTFYIAILNLTLISQVFPPSNMNCGKTLVFKGDSGYIQLNDTLNIGGSSGTIDVWVKIPFSETQNLDSLERVGVILGNRLEAPSSSFEIDSTGVLNIFWNSGEIDVFGGTDLRDNTWHHLVFVRDKINNRFQAYIDGVLDIDHNSAGSDISFSIPHRIGSDYIESDSKRSLHGTIDEFKIWNKALTTSETILFSDSVLQGNEQNLEVYLNFNEGRGSSQLINQVTNLSAGILQNIDTNLSWTLINGIIDTVVITNQSITICRGDTLFYNNNSYVDGGIYTDTLNNTLGCDSVITTDLTVLEPIEFFQTIIICEGDSAMVGNNVYTETNVYLDTLQSSLGCDSIVTTSLSIVQPSSMLVNQAICEGDTFFIGNSFYTQAGSYNDTLQSFFGCDSIIMTELTVNPTFEVFIETEICEGSNYTVGSSSYTQPGNYVDTLQTILGCDSIVQLSLMVFPSYSDTITYTICEGEFIIHKEELYNTAGFFSDTLQTVNGCDSVLSVQINVLPRFVKSVFVERCFGQGYNVGASTYTESGRYYDTLLTSMGCDSIIITTLNVFPQIINNSNKEICSGGSLTVGNNTYTSAGIYADVFTAANGCDSVVVTNLTVSQQLNTSQQIELCTGGVVQVGNNFYNISGEYVDTLTSEVGCDSIVTTSLTVSSTLQSSQLYNICEGEAINVGSSNYTAPGVYIDTLTSQLGCDSIVTSELQVSPNLMTNQNVSICEGGFIQIGSNIYDQSGTYTDTLLSTLSCDSIVNTTLSVSSSVLYNNNLILCEGTVANVGNNSYSLPGTYIDTLINSLGCDSIVITRLSIDLINSAGADNFFTICDTSSQAINLYELLTEGIDTTGVWIDANNSGALNNGIFNPSISGVGAYIIIYETTTQSSCPNDTAFMLITVENCSVIVNTLNQNASKHNWGVYPNPSNGMFNLKYFGSELKEGSQFEVYDLTGKRMLSAPIFFNNTSINLTTLAKQFYLLRVSDGIGNKQEFKIGVYE